MSATPKLCGTCSSVVTLSTGTNSAFSNASLTTFPGFRSDEDGRVGFPEPLEDTVTVPKYWPVAKLHENAPSCDFCHFLLRVVREDAKLRVLDIGFTDTMVMSSRESKWEIGVLLLCFDQKNSLEVNFMLLSDYHKLSAPLGRAAKIHVIGKLNRKSEIQPSPREISRTTTNEIAARTTKLRRPKKKARLRDIFGRRKAEVQPNVVSDSAAQHNPTEQSNEQHRNTVDPNLLIAWLQRCRSFHRDCKARTSSASPARLVDVELQAIVAYPHGVQYAALSYVWGLSKPFTLKTANIGALTTAGGLAAEAGGLQLPRTFQDAMRVTSLLGLRYIWIDALCIKQDDEEETSFEINIMDSIYEGAVVTIVNSTSNAAGGLPRIGENRHQTTPHISFGLHQLEFSLGGHSFAEALWNCPWESRGWTLQEKFFSRRLLIFTPHQVFFHCHEATWSEEDPDDVPLRNNPLERSMSSPLANAYRPPDALQPRGLYEYILRRFVTRNFSNETDVVAAMKGFLVSRSSTLGLDIQGIPSAFFDDYLLWKFDQHHPSERRRWFPSWSWAGWRGTGDLGISFLEVLATTSDRSRRIYWHHFRYDPPNKDTGYRHIALHHNRQQINWGAQQFATRSEIDVVHRGRAKTDMLYADHWPDHSAYLNSLYRVQIPSVPLRHYGPEIAWPEDYLVFWSETAELAIDRVPHPFDSLDKISGPSDKPTHRTRTYNIRVRVPFRPVNASNTLPGPASDIRQRTPWAPFISAINPQGSTVDPLTKSVMGQIALDEEWRAARGDLFEFVVISEAPRTRFGACLNIMLIERDSQGTAQRVQIPDESVQESYWREAQPLADWVILG